MTASQALLQQQQQQDCQNKLEDNSSNTTTHKINIAKTEGTRYKDTITFMHYTIRAA
jgi:hypothetical protein